ncbi:agmatinase [Roseovarius pelagicus]|uniref:Agmatinase n=1 Tax=Roseovarius pelagicus TaxID=2980108 RepID=A0ABY6D717_9RHOB|nr:agmatinase [Roseovarius pelagicus]UXX81664.1 agmatinase [Roseovarius pelagicus]
MEKQGFEGANDGAFTRSDLKGTMAESSYAGALSFMRRKYTRDLTGVDVAVTGIPFDLSVSNRPGTRFGPEAVRKASAQHAWGPVWPWRFDPFDTLAVTDYGDCDFDWGAPMDIPDVIEAHVAGILAAGASTLMLGGDHFCTYPVLRAYAEKFGPLSLVQFDAHRDVEADPGARLDHGSMFNYAIREGVIDPTRSVQLGIRTCFRGEQSYGMRVIYADQAHETPAADLAQIIRETVGDGPAYLTFDIDCLDPSTAPGTGTPVPGGLTSYQALSILRAMKGMDFAGIDVVEVSPPYDHAEMTSNAAAMVAIELLCLKAYARGARAEEMAT